MLDAVQKELAASISKATDVLRRDLATLRAGRANPALLETLRVEYYGSHTPLPQMANINVPEPRLLLVKPWDKSQLKAIEKAIREADLGLNPQVDGDVIRVPIPPLTEERRKEFVKIARKYGEECKVTVRKARHEALDECAVIEKDGGASKDEVDRAKKKVEETMTATNKSIDALVSGKEKDIMEV